MKTIQKNIKTNKQLKKLKKKQTYNKQQKKTQK